MKTRLQPVVVALAIAAAVGGSDRLVSPAFGTGGELHTLDVAIPWGGSDTACPAGYSATTECHRRLGGSVPVRGLGLVFESYVYALETATGNCAPDFVLVLPSSGRLMIKDRGEIFFEIGGGDRCAATSTTDVLDVPQTFTMTRGSGVFAGASGTGVITRTGTGFGANGYGVDNWRGTFSAPNFVEDLTAPTITGSTDKTVVAPRRARTLRVHFTVTAHDDVDGAVRAVCSPRPGARFKVGRRTTVRCSATDKSANTATDRFSVTVRRSKR